MSKHSMSTIADYYREKDQEAKRIYDELQEAKWKGKSEKEIKDIEYRLEKARYVGD